MAHIFISHSSADKAFARKMRTDLEAASHTVFFDEVDIQVGQSIADRVGDGLSECDFIVVLMSDASCQSGWVAREWQSMYQEDIERKGLVILPVLIEKCQIPHLLKSKKYADCTASYSVGFSELMQSIGHAKTVSVVGVYESGARPHRHDLAGSVQDILEKLGGERYRLAQCLPIVVGLARRLNDEDLEEFATHSLRGLGGDGYDEKNPPEWIQCRIMTGWISKEGRINPQFMGWNGNQSAMMNYVKSADGFQEMKYMVPDAISWIENKASEASPESVLQGTLGLDRFTGNIEDSKKNVYAYFEWDSYKSICELIRSKLVSKLARHI